MRVSDGRPRAFRALQVGVCAAAAALLAVLLARHPVGALARAPLLHRPRRSGLPPARALRRQLRRPRGRGAGPGDPAAATRRAPRCSSASPPTRSPSSLGRNRRLTLSSAFDVAQLSLAYAAAALFAARAPRRRNRVGHRRRPRRSRCCSCSSSSTRGWSSRTSSSRDSRPRERLSEIALFQLVALLLLAPIVILEVLVYPPYGVAGTLLAFFPVVLASVVMRNLSSMEQRVRGGLPPEPRARRHAGHLQHLRRERPRRPLRARLRRRRRGCCPVERHGHPRVERRRRRGASPCTSPRGRRRRAASSSTGPGATGSTSARVDRAAAPCEIAAGDAREVRAGARHALPGAGRPLDLRDALGTARPRERLARCCTPPRRWPRCATIADHIALVLQDRSVRAQIQELSERNRERAETLDQILEISNDLKRNRTLDDLFQSIAVGGRQEPRLPAGRAVPLRPRAQRLHAARALRAGRALARPCATRSSRPRRSPSTGTTATGSRSRTTCASAPRESGLARVAGVAPRPRGRRRRLAAGRAPLDPALLRGPAARLPLGRRAPQRQVARPSRRSARSRSSPTRPSPRSRARAPTTRPASSRSATR